MKFCKVFSCAMVIVLTVGILGGCALFPKEEEALAPPLVQPKKQTYETAKVKKGSIDQTVGCSGTLVPAKQYNLYFTQDIKQVRNIAVKAGNTVKEGQVLLTSETGDLDMQIKLEQYSVQLAQLDLQQASAGSDAIGRQKAEIGLEIEQTKLAALKQQKTDATLLSPISGVVTYVADLQNGDGVAAYKTVITVGNPKTLKITVPSDDSLNLIHIGMTAQITAGSGDTAAKIVSLQNTIDSSDQGSDGQTQKNLDIYLEKLPAGAGTGDMASLKVVIAHRDGTLVVPKRAVQEAQGSYTAQVWDGTSKKECEITLGIQSDTQVEVLSGLSEGQNVILF
ncbi:MAG: HlyD family efflux transporter periplasmic adaptor subunit [Clostridia bacterium]|nr:HlyD family efflux transporter periplasmic adaptor subunit [Clostridia bacterium]